VGTMCHATHPLCSTGEAGEEGAWGEGISG